MSNEQKPDGWCLYLKGDPEGRARMFSFDRAGFDTFDSDNRNIKLSPDAEVVPVRLVRMDEDNPNCPWGTCLRSVGSFCTCRQGIEKPTISRRKIEEACKQGRGWDGHYTAAYDDGFHSCAEWLAAKLGVEVVE